ncbi:MAG: desulfoferrodoxin family protein [Bacteroidales bacterium]|nr:desulfoferrodoxin family protein [Bacteroidales bacterium]
MKELEANTVDASVEAHVPLVKCEKKCDVAHPCYEVSVTVGSTLHPSTIEHHISFIVLATESGGDIKILTPKMEPKATFCCLSKPLAVYAYCNLHQLWKAPVSCL